MRRYDEEGYTAFFDLADRPLYGGEIRLMVAVLDDAVNVLRRYPRDGRYAGPYLAAREWLLQDDDRWPFSFVSGYYAGLDTKDVRGVDPCPEWIPPTKSDDSRTGPQRARLRSPLRPSAARSPANSVPR